MRIFNKLRLAYFDELAEDPGVKKLMNRQPSPGWIHCKDSINDSCWSDFFADKFNNGQKYTDFDFKILAPVRWFESSGTSLEINKPEWARSLHPSVGWDVYINPDLHVVYVTRSEGSTNEDAILCFIERNLKSPGSNVKLKAILDNA